MPHRLAASFAAAALALLAALAPAAAGPDRDRDHESAQDSGDDGMTEEQREIAAEILRQMGLARGGPDDRSLGEDAMEPRVPDVPSSGSGDSGSGPERDGSRAGSAGR